MSYRTRNHSGSKNVNCVKSRAMAAFRILPILFAIMTQGRAFGDPQTGQAELPTLAEIAEDVGLPYPPPKTTASHEEVKRKVSQRLDELVKSKLGPFEEENVRSEAEKKYQLWEFGDEVDITDRLGRRFKGRLLKRRRTYIRIGSAGINAVEYTDEIRAHLHEDHRKSAIEAYVKEARANHRENAASIRRKARSDVFAEVCRDHGYVSFRGKWMAGVQIPAFLTSRQQKIRARMKTEREVESVQRAIAKARNHEDIEAAIELLESAIEEHPGAPNLVEARVALQDCEEELYARKQREQGFVEYGGEWMRPKERETARINDKAEDMVRSKMRRNVRFKVMQALEGGSLCVAGERRKYTGEVFLLYQADRHFVADEEEYFGDLYWAGTYSYTTVQDQRKTVNSYAPDMETAREIVKLKFGMGEQGEEAQPPSSTARSDSEYKEPRQVKGNGTGFAVTRAGHIITCYHVVSEAERVVVRTNRESYEAEIVAIDPNSDLALLKIEADLHPVAFSPDRTAKLGQTVFTVGFPNPIIQGFSPKVTRGVVSSLKGIGDDMRAYQIDAAVQPGNSGGPLADDTGQLVGIVNARVNEGAVLQSTGSLPQNVNYAIKKSYCLSLIDTCPDVSERVSEAGKPEGVDFEKAVANVRRATVLILVY